MRTIFCILLLITFSYSLSLPNLETGSMPCLVEEDRIKINENFRFRDLEMGNVICYRPLNSEIAAIKKYASFSPLAKLFFDFFTDTPDYVCHRIVYMGTEGVVVKGDNNYVPDPFFITEDSYKGKVTNWKCR